MAAGITSGMNIAQVRQLAGDMSRAADEIRRLSQQITAKVHNTPWEGPDKKRFESDWQGHVKQLTTVAQALQDASRVATTNAQEQESASSR